MTSFVPVNAFEGFAPPAGGGGRDSRKPSKDELGKAYYDEKISNAERNRRKRQR